MVYIYVTTIITTSDTHWKHSQFVSIVKHLGVGAVIPPGRGPHWVDLGGLKNVTMSTSNSTCNFDRWIMSYFVSWLLIVGHEVCHFKFHKQSNDANIIRGKNEDHLFLWVFTYAFSIVLDFKPIFVSIFWAHCI